MTSGVSKVVNNVSTAVNGTLPSIEEVLSESLIKVSAPQSNASGLKAASRVLDSQAYAEHITVFKKRATALLNNISRISAHEAELMRGIRNGIESTQYFGKLQSAEEKTNYIHVIPGAQKYQSTPQGRFQFHMDMISPTASEHPLPRALINFIADKTEAHAEAVTKAFDDIKKSSPYQELQTKLAKVPGSHRQKTAAAAPLPPYKSEVKAPVKVSGWKRSTPIGTAWGEPPPYKGMFSQRDNPAEEIERLSTLRSRAQQELESLSARLNHINLTWDGIPGERAKLQKRISDLQGYIDSYTDSIDRQNTVIGFNE